jgi:hypothetical protein
MTLKGVAVSLGNPRHWKTTEGRELASKYQADEFERTNGAAGCGDLKSPTGLRSRLDLEPVRRLRAVDVPKIATGQLASSALNSLRRLAVFPDFFGL